MVCINSYKECFIRGISQKEILKDYVDTNTGLTLRVLKCGRTVNVKIASKFKNVVAGNSVITTSFTLDKEYRPYMDSYGTYLLSKGEFNSMKIYSSGKVELVTSSTVTADTTWFECSLTYISAK